MVPYIVFGPPVTGVFQRCPGDASELEKRALRTVADKPADRIPSLNAASWRRLLSVASFLTCLCASQAGCQINRQNVSAPSSHT